MTVEPFSRQEHENRLHRVREELERRELDVLILSSPESIYYVSGYMTRGIAAHQYLAVPADGAPVLATRRRDMGNFLALGERTPISDHASYEDDEGAEKPVDVFIDLLRRNRFKTRRVGIEKGALYLLVEHYEQLKTAMEGSEFIDATGIVAALRLIKSPAELECHRRAAGIVVQGMQAAVAAIRPGAKDSDVAAATSAALIKAGSEWIATWPVVRFGAQTGRAHSSWQHTPIVSGQPTTVEIAGVVMRYHSPLYGTVIHQPSDEYCRIAETVQGATEAGIDAIRPGVTAGEVYRIVESVIAGCGHSDLLVGRIGYCVGIAFPPNWVQRPGIDIVRNNRSVLKPGMVFHLPVVLLRHNAFGIGQSATVMVTESGHENLTADMEPGPILIG
jgi:Xaa-Pro dipeptidase